jgi:CRP-like cAMP-binding protein
MAEEEKSWALKALELDNCPFYAKGDSLQVRMPGVYGNQLQMCSMPVATFIPRAVRGESAEGLFESGYKDCACRWGYCRVDEVSRPAVQFEEVMTAENQMALPFLEQLPSTVAEAFRSRAETQSYKSGEVVLHGLAPSTHFHVIVKGMIRISSKSADGRLMELTVLRKGDCFGEMSILTGAATSNQCDAVEDSQTLAMPKAEFHRLLSEHPVTGIVLYRMLSKRIRAANLKVAQLLSPGLSGDLRYFAFVDLAQSVMTARMTGALHVELDGRRARFGFLEGRLLHASLDNMQGTDALDEVLRWRSGSFRFNGDEALPAANLEGDTMGILLEALRRMDESSILEKVPEGLPAAG